jgi:hypothetical protein
VLVLRIMAPLTADDEVKVKAFADQYQVQFWLQTKGRKRPHRSIRWSRSCTTCCRSSACACRSSRSISRR